MPLFGDLVEDIDNPRDFGGGRRNGVVQNLSRPLGTSPPSSTLCLPCGETGRSEPFGPAEITTAGDQQPMCALGEPRVAVSRCAPEGARVTASGKLTENAEAHAEFALYKEMREIVRQEFVEAGRDVHAGRGIELAHDVNAIARSGKTGKPDEH